MPKEKGKRVCVWTPCGTPNITVCCKLLMTYMPRASREKSSPNLMELILSQDNIMLAYRNIKSNTGSYTAGTDHQNIGDIGKLPPSVVIEKVRKIVTGSQHGYRPKTCKAERHSETQRQNKAAGDSLHLG